MNKLAGVFLIYKSGFWSGSSASLVGYTGELDELPQEQDYRYHASRAE